MNMVKVKNLHISPNIFRVFHIYLQIYPKGKQFSLVIGFLTAFIISQRHNPSRINYIMPVSVIKLLSTKESMSTNFVIKTLTKTFIKII